MKKFLKTLPLAILMVIAISFTALAGSSYFTLSKGNSESTLFYLNKGSQVAVGDTGTNGARVTLYRIVEWAPDQSICNLTPNTTHSFSATSANHYFVWNPNVTANSGAYMGCYVK